MKKYWRRIRLLVNAPFWTLVLLVAVIIDPFWDAAVAFWETGKYVVKQLPEDMKEVWKLFVSEWKEEDE